MDKRGIELSVNLLVIIIISLVVLGGGIALLYRFIAGAEELQATLDERTEEQLQSLLIDEGQQVALSRHTVKVRGEGEGILGIGVLNTGEEDSFTIEVQGPRYLNAHGGQPSPQTTPTVLYNTESFSLKQHAFKVEPILIKVPTGTPRGTYVFDVKVKRENGSQYGSTKKIYVIVE
jgi:hypothetical protein